MSASSLPRLTEEQVLRLLRQRCVAAGSIAKWARQNGISGAFASEVLNRNRPLGPKVLRALRLRKVIEFEKE